MKVLHLNEHCGWYGGIETYLLSVIPRMVDRGHPQVVAFSKGDAELVEHSHVVPELSHASRRAIDAGRRAIEAIVERERPDLAHVHNIHNIGAIEACLESVPTVVTIHDYRYACPASNFYYRRTEEVCHRSCGPGCFTTTLFKRCLTPRPRYAMRYYGRVRWAMRNAGRFARFVAPSQFARQRFSEVGYDGSRIDVVPYFCPVLPRDEPRVPPQQTTLLFLGRMQPNKGYRYFIEALGKMPASVRGVMVGNSSPERQQEIMHIAADARCRDRLELRSWVSRDEIQGLLEATSVLVFPSVWPETLGIVGLEALASGVPVVASDIGGVREWLHEGETGYLVPPKSSSSIAEAVSRLLDCPAVSAAMGRRGIELIREKFAPEVHMDKLADTYRLAVAYGVN